MTNSEITTVLVWPNGLYHVVGEDSEEEIEQAIAYQGDDFTMLHLSSSLTLEEIEAYVAEWTK